MDAATWMNLKITIWVKGERLSGVYWESISRQIDKKSGVPKEERGVWSSKGGEKDKLFFLHSLVT